MGASQGENDLGEDIPKLTLRSSRAVEFVQELEKSFVTWSAAQSEEIPGHLHSGYKSALKAT